MQFCYRFDFAVLAFLQLRREHILEPVRLVERKRNRLIVRINHEITATRLVIRIKIVPFEYRKITPTSKIYIRQDKSLFKAK